MATRDKFVANWEQLHCVDYYIMKLEKVGPVEMLQFDDDEDYEYEEGSGSGEFSTTRPKREMTEGTVFSLIMEDTTVQGVDATELEESITMTESIADDYDYNVVGLVTTALPALGER
eukprot:TRINITY_DN14434_c0_g1_i1.p1 TRINITY_DN14434_c0_g1~~TRINITY_DN14434_c0_g1_i1.p1  ORF type:complete len:136 (+),score=47.10 TRINITY_DN14434_c0_g1_i1:59-409(+)